MLTLLRQRNFSLLWFGGFISFAGDWVLFVALPLYVLNLTGSVLATGAIFIVNTIPGILLGSVAGVFVDRWDRRITLVVANLIRGPLLLPLLLVDSPDRVWIIYVIGFIGRSVGEFMYPAEHALLPKLVGEDKLVKANALNALNNNLARLVGPALGGVIVGIWGFSSAVLFDAVSFVVAGALISLISAPRSVTRAEHHVGEGETTPPRPNLVSEWRAGLALVGRSRVVLALFVLLAINGLAEGLIVVLIPVYIKESLGGGELELGWLLSGQALGGLIGGFFTGWLSDRMTPRQMVGFGFVLVGIIDAAIFNTTSVWVAVGLMMLIGLPVVALVTGAMTLLQLSVPDRFRGRVMGAFGTTQSVVMLVAMSFSSAFGGAIGAVTLLTVAAVFDALAGVAAFAFLPKGAPAGEEIPPLSAPLENTAAD